MDKSQKNDSESKIEKERENLIHQMESQLSDEIVRSIKLSYELSKKKPPYVEVIISDHNNFHA